MTNSTKLGNQSDFEAQAAHNQRKAKHELGFTMEFGALSTLAGSAAIYGAMEFANNPSALNALGVMGSAIPAIIMARETHASFEDAQDHIREAVHYENLATQ